MQLSWRLLRGPEGPAGTGFHRLDACGGHGAVQPAAGVDNQRYPAFFHRRGRPCVLQAQPEPQLQTPQRSYAEIPHFRAMQDPRRASQREVLTVSNRGQITLPAEMRRHLGIEPGGAVIVEDCGGELRLRPAAVLEVELYADEDIAEWDQADALSDQERRQILERLASC